MTTVTKKKTFLHQLIADFFNDQELRELCFELGGAYAYDNLPGESNLDKARELVAAAIRRSEVSVVREKLKEKRPFADWDSAVLPGASVYVQSNRALIISLVVLVLLGGVGGFAFWQYMRASQLWATYEVVPEDQVGIAVAELGVSADCRRGTAGREASALIFETLESQITGVGLHGRVPLTKIGLVCDQESAIREGERVGVDVVVWGWVPQTTEGILGQYTFVEPPRGPGATTLAQSLELLVSGPASERYYQLSGRTEALVRFVLGLVYAKEENYVSSLAMFDRAIQLVEADSEASINTDSLTVLYTERGKTHAAMENPDLAFESYQIAESLNPDYIGLQMALGAYYYTRREWDLARDYYDKADSQEEELPSTAYGYGLLDYYAGDHEKAIDNFELALARGVDLEEELLLPWLGIGYSYMKLGRCPQAIEAFQVIVRQETVEEDLSRAAAEEIAKCESLMLTPSPAPNLPTSTLLATMVEAGSTPPFIGTPLGSTSSPSVTSDVTATATLSVAQTWRAVEQLVCMIRRGSVRSGADTSYSVLTTLEIGTAVPWVATGTDGWYSIWLADGHHGWISTSDAAPCLQLTSTARPGGTLEIESTAFPQSSPTLMSTIVTIPVPTHTLLPGEPYPVPTTTPTLLPPSTDVPPEPTDKPMPTETLLPVPTETPAP
jgi:Tfp pilus assembly protein PilF